MDRSALGENRSHLIATPGLPHLLEGCDQVAEGSGVACLASLVEPEEFRPALHGPEHAIDRGEFAVADVDRPFGWIIPPGHAEAVETGRWNEWGYNYGYDGDDYLVRYFPQTASDRSIRTPPTTLAYRDVLRWAVLLQYGHGRVTASAGDVVIDEIDQGVYDGDMKLFTRKLKIDPTTISAVLDLMKLEGEGVVQAAEEVNEV